MFHRRSPSSKKSLLKNLSSWVYARLVSSWISFRFRKLRRHHKIAILVASIGVFLVSSLAILGGLYGDTVLGQVNFRLSILAVPECQNNLDDDADGLIDYPLDPDCTSSDDTSEEAPIPPTVACSSSVVGGTVNQPIIWMATPADANDTYTYSWSGSDGLTGTTASITKTYTTAGTKTASVTIVNSSGVSSLPTSCESILIKKKSPPRPKDEEIPPVVPQPPVVSPPPTTDKKDDTPPLDAAPPAGDDGQHVSSHSGCTISTIDASFQDYKNYLVCDNAITPRATEKEYEYSRYTPRKELLGVAVTIAGHLGSVADIGATGSSHFLDVGVPGQSAWIFQTVEKAVALQLVSIENQFFRPDDNVTRAEAFSILMSSVCMDTSASPYASWEQRVHDVAYKNDITVRSWKDFQPQSPILRQELFVIATKLDFWGDMRGGCTLRPLPKPLQSAPPVQQSVPVSFQNTATTEGLQQPGAFALLYEDETKKVYSYIIKNGGMPQDVRLQYLRIFGENTTVTERLSVHDIAGTEFAENRWLIAGELVYVTFRK